MEKVNNFIVQRPSITRKPIEISPKTPNVLPSFDDILKGKINENSQLKFSKHAELRMQSRNINLSKEQLHRVEQAVDKAAAKGVKESLIMVDDVALVVSVKNKTVITAVDSKELKENVFTNIDGAVIT